MVQRGTQSRGGGTSSRGRGHLGCSGAVKAGHAAPRSGASASPSGMTPALQEGCTDQRNEAQGSAPSCPRGARGKCLVLAVGSGASTGSPKIPLLALFLTSHQEHGTKAVSAFCPHCESRLQSTHIKQHFRLGVILGMATSCAGGAANATFVRMRVITPGPAGRLNRAGLTQYLLSEAMNEMSTRKLPANGFFSPSR